MHTPPPQPPDIIDLTAAAPRAHTAFASPSAAGHQWPTRAAVAADVYDYLMERQRNAGLQPPDGGPPMPGITPEICDAVIAARPRSPLDFDARVRALIQFLALPEGPSLTAANKRISNLLKKSAGGEDGGGQIDAAQLQLPAERALFAALQGAMHSVPGHIAGLDYANAFTELAKLRPAVDAFFDGVMVMDPDPALRANRLGMLAQLRALFAGIADLSRLPG
jgi:glycyl-tRNA synthetase beta subunit